MVYENILFERDGAVGILTVNRPKSLNALNPATLREIAACLEAGRQDQSIRCLIITGEGDRAFIAGADISAMVSMTALEGKAFAALGLGVLRTLEELPIPVIAAVNGFALGGGTELALACDLIIAADKAKFGQPEINLGVIPGFGGTQRLARRIGLPRARELIYTGDMIDAEAALRYGLANKVVPLADLMTEVKALAHKLATKPPIAIRQAKVAINAGIDLDLENGCRFENEAFALTFATVDKVEGMTAFLEKRAANFKGE
ncbi:MAG: enoyl-CoA hydratase/isomerase family protein [Deltaproteobacteria bacterium]|nr:enoyl-CoA hydratase/isomerase family protein [Deltaproteobacteria bacterium]